MPDENDQQGHDRDLIKVIATFSIGKRDAFHQMYSNETIVGTVLAAVRIHFDAKDEPNVIWYLSAHDERQSDASTLEQVARGRDEITFRLVKELTQG
jgi:hypothetical protein